MNLSRQGEEKPRHILIVEDDPNTADMLTTYFTSLGYKVSHAAWGQDALALAEKHTPDLVLLDIHLPDIDGYEVCIRLRSQRRTEHVPIVFLTERKDRMDRLTGLNLGAIDYITKPFDVQELRYRIRNILRRSNLESLLHPVTGLPTSMLVEEQLEKARTDSRFSIIGLRLKGMKAFSDAYGFITHDDVLRAVVLILRNTASELTSQDPFIGQLETYLFVLIVPEEKRYPVMGRLHQRLSEVLSFFYPHRDWETGQRSDGQPLPRITFEMGYILASDFNPEGGLMALKEVLFPPTGK